MNTQANMPLAGVIGYPISHSKSPALHGYWLRRYGLSGHYIPLPVLPEHLPQALRTLPQLGFRGVNVTIPHKEEALKLARTASDRAARIGAANTLTFYPDGGFHADNTDGYGFIANIRQGAPDWQAAAGPAVVLGAGGAARAVIDALLDAGTPKIFLANRTAARAEALGAHFGNRVTGIVWADTAARLGCAATLVNTTALGMAGKPPLELDLAVLPATALVTDIVYSPLRTDLLERAEERGCTTVGGLGMLLHQAAPGFEAWFGRWPDVDDDLRRAVLAG